MLTGIVWDYVDTNITTRDRVTVVVTASFDDGSTADVTAAAAYSTEDSAVLKVYTPGVFQPIDSGYVAIGANYGGFDVTGALNVSLVPATNADLVFNEVLADGTVDGDPNGDGRLDSVEDEFVEIANLSAVTVDLSGCTIVEDDFGSDIPRHTFAEGTVLRAGEAIVVFGGGMVGGNSAPNVTFLAAQNADDALRYGLSLNNEGERVSLLDPTGGILTTFSYGAGGDIDAIEDASMVRSPDVTGGTWTHHTYAAGSTGDFSPGHYVDGSDFPGPDGIYAP